VAQRQLANVSQALSFTQERLASGQRINRASDDAAGLSIAEKLRSDTRVFTQAIRNVNDGVSALNIAEGTLSQLSTILTRQLELAEQAANGTYGINQRRALNLEANALVDEFNRIIATTQFNKINLLDASTTSFQVQAGFGNDGVLAVDISTKLARYVGDGTFKAQVSYNVGNAPSEVVFGDFNEDGNIDVVVPNSGDDNLTLYRGSASGTLSGPTVVNTGNDPLSIATADLNSDGHLDLVTGDLLDGRISVLLGVGDGTFKARVSYLAGNLAGNVTIADFNNDGKLDLVNTNINLGEMSVAFGLGDGTFGGRTSYALGNRSAGIAVGDLNGDGYNDIVTSDYQTDSIYVMINNGSGGFGSGGVGSKTAYSAGTEPRKINTGDFNRDGYLDLVVTDRNDNNLNIYIGNGDGSFKSRVSYAATNIDLATVSVVDIDGDGNSDLVTADLTDLGAIIFLGNSDGTFKNRSVISGFQSTVRAGDLNGDGVVDLVTTLYSGTSMGVLLGNSRRTTTMPYLNICTAANAREALGLIRSAFNRVSAETGQIGASQSRLQITLNTLATSRENYEAAASRIIDADVAFESANLVRQGILQKAASSVLAQVNQEPALVLTLLS